MSDELAGAIERVEKMLGDMAEMGVNDDQPVISVAEQATIGDLRTLLNAVRGGTFCGLKIVEDETVPPGQIELRNP